MPKAKEHDYFDTIAKKAATFYTNKRVDFEPVTKAVLLEYIQKESEWLSLTRVQHIKILKAAAELIIPHLQNTYIENWDRWDYSKLGLLLLAEEDALFPEMYENLKRFINGLTKLERLPPSLNGLAAFAADRQNVHTKEVVEQTKTIVKQLVVDSSKKYTLNIILNAWLGQPYVDYNKLSVIYEDMKTFGNKSYISVNNDYAYRNLLKGAVQKILNHPEKEELWKRLYEEASDSVGMCAQGHLTRIANVFVGFELEGDIARASAPRELFQGKFALLSQKDISMEEKLGEAKELFQEFQIPDSDQQAWIDAL